MKFLRAATAGVEIDIAVVPNARLHEIIGEHAGRLKMKIHAPPVDGKANAAVIEFFAKVLGRPKSAVSIKRGEQSRQKTVAISGLKAEAAREIILRLL